MKELTKAAFNFKYRSKQTIAPKQFNHKVVGNPDDFIKNASNGVKLRKATV